MSFFCGFSTINEVRNEVKRARISSVLSKRLYTVARTRSRRLKWKGDGCYRDSRKWGIRLSTQQQGCCRSQRQPSGGDERLPREPQTPKENAILRRWKGVRKRYTTSMIRNTKHTAVLTWKSEKLFMRFCMRGLESSCLNIDARAERKV